LTGMGLGLYLGGLANFVNNLLGVSATDPSPSS
jgi:hypothetical protein